MIKVLVVDVSIFMRRVISDAVNAAGDMVVVGTVVRMEMAQKGRPMRMPQASVPRPLASFLYACGRVIAVGASSAPLCLNRRRAVPSPMRRKCVGGPRGTLAAP